MLESHSGFPATQTRRRNAAVAANSRKGLELMETSHGIKFIGKPSVVLAYRCQCGNAYLNPRLLLAHIREDCQQCRDFQTSRDGTSSPLSAA